MLTPARSALLLAALIFNAASLTTAAPTTEANEADLHLRSVVMWKRPPHHPVVKEDAQETPVQKPEEKSAKLASRDSDTFALLRTTGRTFVHVHTKDMPNGPPVVSGEVMSGGMTRFSSVTVDDGRRKGCCPRRHRRCCRRFRHRPHYRHHCGGGGHHHHHHLEGHGQYLHDQDSTGEHHHYGSASDGSWRELDEHRHGTDEHNHPSSHHYHHHPDERENLRDGAAKTDHAAEVEGHERDHQPHQDKREGHNEGEDHGSRSPAPFNDTVSHPPHETHPLPNTRG